MIDIGEIRENPERFKQAVTNKGIDLDIDQLLEVDARRRTIGKEVNDLREQRNRISEQVKKSSEDREANIARSREIGTALATKEEELQKIDADFMRLMAFVPGVPVAEVPIGKSDKDNIEIRRVGEPGKKNFEIKDHMELAIAHAMVDFEGARNAAGSRAYALVGNGALLELAVLRFALDRVIAKGFIPVLPPLMVKEHAMFGTGYFPIGEENAYELERDKQFLTGTSEVGIVSMRMNETYDLCEVPLRYAGISACFRREAGAAGRDTKGLYRVHQFQKVEQVVFCINDKDESEKEHFALLANAEEIVQALELPYRVMAMCTAELGLGQVRKHDIETWMPGRGDYGETHSCSTFHEFQARRLGIRYRDEEQKKHFVHTLNNTAIASPRILIAILENHQNKDGSIHVPAALRPYLYGREVLEPGAPIVPSII